MRPRHPRARARPGRPRRRRRPAPGARPGVAQPAVVDVLAVGCQLVDQPARPGTGDGHDPVGRGPGHDEQGEVGGPGRLDVGPAKRYVDGGGQACGHQARAGRGTGRRRRRPPPAPWPRPRPCRPRPRRGRRPRRARRRGPARTPGARGGAAHAGDPVAGGLRHRSKTRPGPCGRCSARRGGGRPTVGDRSRPPCPKSRWMWRHPRSVTAAFGVLCRCRAGARRRRARGHSGSRRRISSSCCRAAICWANSVAWMPWNRPSSHPRAGPSRCAARLAGGVLGGEGMRQAAQLGRRSGDSWPARSPTSRRSPAAGHGSPRPTRTAAPPRERSLIIEPIRMTLAGCSTASPCGAGSASTTSACSTVAGASAVPGTACWSLVDMRAILPRRPANPTPRVWERGRAGCRAGAVSARRRAAGRASPPAYRTRAGPRGVRAGVERVVEGHVAPDDQRHVAEAGLGRLGDHRAEPARGHDVVAGQHPGRRHCGGRRPPRRGRVPARRRRAATGSGPPP